MKTISQRLNNISGQIEGVKKMRETECDCIKVLTQLKAIKSAISGVMDAIMEEQYETCFKTLSEKDKKLFIKLKEYVKSN